MIDHRHRGIQGPAPRTHTFRKERGDKGFALAAAGAVLFFLGIVGINVAVIGFVLYMAWQVVQHIIGG